jgi:two-component system, response regulator
MTDKLILLVEDNPDDEELTLIALKQGGILVDVVVARDGPEALDCLFGTASYAGRTVRLPQVILLDLKLPKLSGLEVLERIRANRATACIPVVVMTSSSEEEDIVSSYRLGANSYVRKPVAFQAFSEAVQKVAQYWLLLNVTPVVKLRP